MKSTLCIYNSFLKALNSLSPLMMLALRLWMARIFFNSGLVKISDWSSTIALFRDEYKVPVLNTEFAAVVSTVFELSCPVLLVVGLAARLATLPLLAMTAVIQFTYDSNIEHLYWAFLLGTILFYGPNKISLDYWFSKNFNSLKSCSLINRRV